MFKKIFDFLFFRSEYQVKFFSFFNFSFKIFYIVVLLIVLVFRFVVFLFQQITTGFDNFAFLINIFIVFLLFYPLFFVFRFVVMSFYDDFRFRYFVYDELKRFFVLKKFVLVNYKPYVSFSFGERFLVVRIRLDGSFNDKFLNLGMDFAHLFVLDLHSVVDNDGFVEYVFRRFIIEQDKVSDIVDSDMLKFIKDSVYIAEGFVWNFRKKPHALITGLTGSGKTFFLAYFTLVFKKFGATIKVLDAKRSDMSFLKKYFGSDVASDLNHIARVLREVVSEIDVRFEEFEKNVDYGFGKDYFDYNYKPIFVIFDEFVAFMSVADKKLREEVNGYIGKIVLQGRQAGINLIITAQRPDAEYIKGNFRDNFSLRVAFGSLSEDGYKMVLGNEFRSLKLNISGAGSGYGYILGMDKPLEFFSPYMNINFISELESVIGYKKINLEKNVDDIEVS